MRILLRVLVVLLVIGGGAYLYALSIPAEQTYTRTITLKQTPEAVFALLEDVEEHAEVEPQPRRASSSCRRSMESQPRARRSTAKCR